MALSRSFKETVKKRIERDPAFRKELLKEGIECLLVGDVDTGIIEIIDQSLHAQQKIDNTKTQLPRKILPALLPIYYQHFPRIYLNCNSFPAPRSGEFRVKADFETNIVQLQIVLKTRHSEWAPFAQNLPDNK